MTQSRYINSLTKVLSSHRAIAVSLPRQYTLLNRKSVMGCYLGGIWLYSFVLHLPTAVGVCGVGGCGGGVRGVGCGMCGVYLVGCVGCVSCAQCRVCGALGEGCEMRGC